MSSTSRHHPAVRAISFLLALALLAGLVVAAFASLFTSDPHNKTKILYAWNWDAVWKYRQIYWDGWLTTVAIAAIALPLSCLAGVLLATARRAPWLPLRQAAQILVELTRGTPLLVQILIYWYVIGTPLGIQNRYLAGPLVLAAFSGAYISEIVRAGIESVGLSQLESARAIGLTRGQTYRHIIFPQALRQMLPSLAGQFVSLVKDSSLLSVIALQEFTKAAESSTSFDFAFFESYLTLAVGYLIITLPISLWTQRLERTMRYDT